MDSLAPARSALAGFRQMPNSFRLLPNAQMARLVTALAEWFVRHNLSLDMPTKHQKELKHQRRASRRIEERQSWEAELAARPLSPEVFADLRRYVEERSSIESTGIFDACHEHDHKLRLVLEFLRQRDIELPKIVDWFQRYEATCDHLVVELGDEWGPYGSGFERRYA